MIKVLSYGGGLDSFAMLLDALARGEKPDHVVFCDVAGGCETSDAQVPGEWPGTYRHIREVVLPLCRQEGIPFHWLDGTTYPIRDASSLFEWFAARGQIPTASKRTCTVAAKTERFEAWMADHLPGQEVEVWIGFEAGEEDRAAKDPNAGTGKASLRRNRFPLIEAGLCRCLCEQLVRNAGFPVPRKSACTFCPMGSKGDWQTLARELPATFAQIAKLEADKPLTGPGKKLSIMGFQTLAPLKNGKPRTAANVLRDHDGVEYKAPPLPVFIQGEYEPEVIPCEVCGAANRASKATACGYLD